MQQLNTFVVVVRDGEKFLWQLAISSKLKSTKRKLYDKLSIGDHRQLCTTGRRNFNSIDRFTLTDDDVEREKLFLSQSAELVCCYTAVSGCVLWVIMVGLDLRNRYELWSECAVGEEERITTCLCVLWCRAEEGIGEMRAPLVSRRVINFKIRVFMTPRAACVSVYLAGMLSNSSSVSDIQK